MKITEITDSNNAWITLYGHRIEQTINQYGSIIDIWPLIKQSKSPALIKVHQREINQFLEDVLNFSDVLKNAPEPNDPDIADYRKRLKNMYSTLSEIVNN